MPINPTTLKALIDTQITNETVDFAIAPNEVGGRMKDTIDYTTEQIAGIPDAQEGVKGIASLASTVEVGLGVNATKIVTPVKLKAVLDLKQNTLVSGTNIKTINGSDILGSGDLVVSGGGTQVTKSVKVTLTPLQVQSLFTTRVKVIDCPSGIAILPIQMLCIANNPTTAYSPSGGGAVLRYDTLASNILSCNTTLGNVGSGEGYAISASSLTSAEFSRNGEDVYIKLASNDPVGGDGGLVVYITYSELTL